MLLAVDSLSLIVGLRLEWDAEGWLCAEEVLRKYIEWLQKGLFFVNSLNPSNSYVV